MDIRKESEINSRLYKSLQTCTVKNNLKKLLALRYNTKGSKLKSKFDALINVLENLQLPDNYLIHCLDPETLNHNVMCPWCTSQVKIDESRPDEQKTKFKDALLNEESGLRCFIFLDSDELDLLSYFEEFIREENNFLDNEKFKKQSITNHHQLKSCIRSMETWYDKNVLKSILSMLVTDRDLELIGVKPSIKLNVD